MYKLLTCCLLVSLALSREASAQDSSLTISKVTIASPTAASLGKYGDIPVSYHTGVPEISIPLHSVATSKLKIPITLSYHSGGLKPAELSSWVGAGWDLNAGGVITRAVVGAPDDKGSGGSNYFTNGYYSDYGYHNYLWIYQPGLLGSAPDGYAADDGQFLAGRKDGEPDMYTYNFCGQSGKFYFRDDRRPIFQPSNNLRIETDYVDGQGFRGFVVTTTDGTKYYFGKTGNNGSVDPLEVTIPGTLQYSYANANAAVSSWYLNKVVTFDKTDSVTFEYTAESYSYHTLATVPLSSAFVSSFMAPANVEYYLVKNFVKGVRLSKINYAAGHLFFTPAANPRIDLSAGWQADGSMYDTVNTEARALGSITFQNNSGTVCKKDSFYYNYWADTSALRGTLATTYSSMNLHSDRYRLRLDSLKELACDGSINIPAHRFNYFTEPVLRRLTFGIDFWGFANGKTSNTRLQPTVYSESTTRLTLAGADRDPVWPAMRGGGLQSIIFPTGGTTEMVFEPHDTYVIKDTFSTSPWTSRSVGFFGAQARDTFTAYLAGNYMTYSFNSSAGGGEAHVKIYNGYWGGSLAYEFGSIQPGESKEGNFTLPAGTYCFELVKQNTASGIGAGYNVQEWVAHHVEANTMVGGYRIKKKLTYDNLNPDPQETDYIYRVTKDTSAMSSGILYTKLPFIQVIRNDVWGDVFGPTNGCSYNGCASCDGQTEHTYYTSGATLRPMETCNGSHIAYNDVFVFQPNDGYSVYRYYGLDYSKYSMDDICVRRVRHSSLCDSHIPNYPEAPPQFDPMRTELKFEGHYDNNNTLVKSTWHYPKYEAEPITTPGIKSASIGNLFTHTIYELASFKKVGDSTEVTDYISSGQRKRPDDASISSTKTTAEQYTSIFHYLPTTKILVSASRDTFVTTLQYPPDFPTPHCFLSPDSIGYYLNKMSVDSGLLKNALAFCGPDATSGYGSCRYGKYQQYRRALSLDRLQLKTYLVKYFSDSAKNACAAYMEGSATDSLTKAILRMQQQNRIIPIEVVKWKNRKFLEAGLAQYDFFNGYPYLRISSAYNAFKPGNSYQPAASTDAYIIRDDRFVPQTYVKYNRGNVSNINPRRGTPVGYIWDYQNHLLVAQANGTEDSAIAYTSFEAEGSGSWNLGSTSRDTSTAITGKSAYNLSNGNITRSGLVDSVEYYVSYWSRNSTPLTITGTKGTAQQSKTINGWTCFQHLITGVTSVTLSGSGLIDEVRMYPKWAEMTTYTHDPGAGISSICDQRNQITYYSFDKIGRLVMVKDMDGNILQTHTYQYQEQQ